MNTEDYDKLFNMVLEIKEKTIENSIVLQEHMRRTELAEERIELLTKDIEPIKDHVKFVGWLIKSVIALVPVLAAAVGILEFFRH